MSGLNTVRSLIAPVARRVRLLVTRAVVDRVNDSLRCQGLQVSLLSDELRDDVEHFQDYGFTSHPLVGAEGLFLAVGGNRSHGVVLGVTDRRYRPTNMSEGDVCLHTADGERVYLDRAGDLVNLGAKSASDFVALAADVLSELQSFKTDLDNVKSMVDSHTHNVPATGILDGLGSPCTGVAVSATPSQSVPTPHTPASVAASKVKAT